MDKKKKLAAFLLMTTLLSLPVALIIDVQAGVIVWIMLGGIEFSLFAVVSLFGSENH